MLRANLQDRMRNDLRRTLKAPRLALALAAQRTPWLLQAAFVGPCVDAVPDGMVSSKACPANTQER
jgi:hypothetical protein